DVAGATEFQQHVTGRDDASGQSRGDMIGGAAKDWQPLWRARCLGRRAGNGADLLMRAMDRWNRGAGKVRQRDQIVVERIRRKVDQASLERPVAFEGTHARQAPVDIVVGTEDGCDPGKNLRLVTF